MEEKVETIEEEGIEEEIVEEEIVEELEGETKEEPKEIPEDSDKFTLPKTEPIPVESDETEIVHNGQVYRFKKDKIVELAQKGFDYDYKIGPHGKIAKMIESDPNLANVVNDYWQGKTNPKPESYKVKSIEDYENETEWLQDNLQKALESVKPQVVQQPPQNQANTTLNSLKMRDPEHYNAVLPKMAEYAAQLSVADYQKIDSDITSLYQFYDFVKERVVSKKVKPPIPGFKVKSGGGENNKSAAVPVWKLSKTEFQKQLDKIKGYTQ